MNLPNQHPASLRDIHLPDAVSWWPPAIGWWILLALIIVAIIFVPKLYRRITYTPLKKVAENTFKHIVAKYNRSHDNSGFINETSRFLRQTAMSYCGREEIAQLTGEQWVKALNNISGQTHFNDEIKQSLLNAPYQKNVTIDTEQLIQSVQNWLSDLPRQPARAK